MTHHDEQKSYDNILSLNLCNAFPWKESLDVCGDAVVSNTDSQLKVSLARSLNDTCLE